jgi:hypothetical protein
MCPLVTAWKMWWQCGQVVKDECEHTIGPYGATGSGAVRRTARSRLLAVDLVEYVSGVRSTRSLAHSSLADCFQGRGLPAAQCLFPVSVYAGLVGLTSCLAEHSWPA